MDWLGIGVLVIAIALLLAVIFLRPVFVNLAKTLDNTAETVSTLNKSLGEITSETTVILYNTNETLVDVNDKIAKLNPLFTIIHDTGQAAHSLTSSLAHYTANRASKADAGTDYVDAKNFEGIMRGAAFVYYLRNAKKEYDAKKNLGSGI
ncbi:DUF948 domain-containing protein [Paenalkalicoccus suaedae]|uniref:DUF948 domain-containing protein n=1 Tax=Paenalkalicoccus suaedae TaxID=2592382 RepID=A0A859FCA2_9BACI|nr:DUF948 domain-containing protein [Paenalkalicoccus suaedae]QKS70458.1 DUF948 domain-containing protein [Paenalkalicoccus suaedae]